MDDLIAELLSLFEAQFTTTFKDYNYGDTFVYDRTELPALFVYPISTTIEKSGTVRDETTHTVGVKLVLNHKTYLEMDDTNDIQHNQQQLVKWVEDTNVNKEIIDTSIIGVVRKNIDVSGYTLYNDTININYEDQNISPDNKTLLKKVDIVLVYKRRGIRNT